jgi:NADPH:quinone reductase-like Zn-dependent oxidoreductase
MMKAVVQDKYGSPDKVLQLREIDKPVAEADEVLVQVRAASVHPDVWHMVTGRPYVLRLMGAGLPRPKDRVPGTDLAGQIVSVGKDVTQFRAGDEVFGESFRGLQWKNGGTFAEYAAVPEETIELKPSGISFEQASTVPTSGLIALNNLRNERVKPGQRVLVNGAGGGVGTVAVQLAKAYGAHVTGVDGTEKLELVRSLGADVVIDYTRDNFTQSGERYDLILDVASNLSLAACKRSFTPSGIYVLIGHDHFGQGAGRVFGSLPRFLRILALSKFVNHLPDRGSPLPSKKESMAALRELLASGKLTPVVDRTFPLSQVPKAIRYLAEGHPRGRIVITP